MIKISKLERQNRKTLSIVINKNGEVVIKAPLRLPMQEIEKFVLSKSNWIESKLKKLAQMQGEYEDVINYSSLMIFGKIYPIFTHKKAKQLVVTESEVFVPENYTGKKLLSKSIKFYKDLAEDYILPRIKEISEKINLIPAETKCTGSRGRWGACTSKKLVTINFRAVVLPKHLIDYIIVHELAHLIELNHSANFWKIVGKILPSYKTYKNELKKYGFILKIF